MEAGPPPSGIWGLTFGEIDQETYLRMLTDLKKLGRTEIMTIANRRTT